MRSEKAVVIPILASAVALAMCIDDVVGQKIRLPFRSNASTEQEDLQLTQRDGPWLILCASFVGDEGEYKARQLAKELRHEHKLKAFVYKHRFDHTRTVEGIGWEVYEVDGRKELRPKRMKPNNQAQFEEIAVLVGDFPTVDDARAQRALDKIKHLQPNCLANFDPKRGTSQSLRLWRTFVAYKNAKQEDLSKGPLRAAFLLTNPLLPDEYFEAARVDHFVINLNKNVKHSLLKCPSVYSVRVATFRGDSTFELNEIAEKTKEQRWRMRIGKPIKSSKLAEATEKAHRLTSELRKAGVEAYEFHDRFESYVCVGGFDWVTRNGQFNPDVVKTINSFKANIEDLPKIQGAILPKVLPSLRGTDIVFDPQPVPVVVPRAQVSTSTKKGLWK